MRADVHPTKPGLALVASLDPLCDEADIWQSLITFESSIPNDATFSAIKKNRFVLCIWSNLFNDAAKT